MFFSMQFLQSNTTQQHARCIRHGMRFGKVSHPHIFPCTALCRFLYSCICFLHLFSCNACQSVSLRISLCSLEHCFTASTRIMSENKKQICASPMTRWSFAFLLIRASMHHSLHGLRFIVTLHISGTCQTQKRKPNTQKIKYAHLPWPIGHNLVVRTSVCLLHMV